MASSHFLPFSWAQRCVSSSRCSSSSVFILNSTWMRLLTGVSRHAGNALRRRLDALLHFRRRALRSQRDHRAGGRIVARHVLARSRILSSRRARRIAASLGRLPLMGSIRPTADLRSSNGPSAMTFADGLRTGRFILISISAPVRLRGGFRLLSPTFGAATGSFCRPR